MFELVAQSYYTTTDLDSMQYQPIPPEMLWPVIIISLITVIASIVGLWKIFEKAGQKGWKAIIPIYNLVTLFQIIGRSPWLILIYLLTPIPLIGAVAALILTIITTHDLSRSFGKGVGMTILNVLFPFIGYPILGFGDAVYRGPAAKEDAGTPPATPAQPTNTPPATPTA
ncbi:MAG TPA: DUF5684 domain-containing protein [Verrucomicrobiae bacterium]|nr:DUF5684 domain-containing protein [Verrucomicrobiae bacterium]